MCCDLAYVEPLLFKENSFSHEEEQKKKQTRFYESNLTGSTWYHEWVVFIRLLGVFSYRDAD